MRLTILLFYLSISSLSLCDDVPSNGQVIKSSMIWVKNVYHFDKGITIGGDNVDIDMNGSTLKGSNFQGNGITINGRYNVTIRNGVINGYYYSISSSNSKNIFIRDNNLSHNKNIKYKSNADSEDQLGGGISLNNVIESVVINNQLSDQQNGMILVNCKRLTIVSNYLSNLAGSGISLEFSTYSTIVNNTIYKTHLGNTTESSIVIHRSSNHNIVSYNLCTNNGRGIFVGSKEETSNDNIIQGNDVSNSIETSIYATGGTGNWFLFNNASSSRSGIIFDSLVNNTVIYQNSVSNNLIHGVSVKNGQNILVKGNHIQGNQYGITLSQDSQTNTFPPKKAQVSSGYTIVDNYVIDNKNYGISLESTIDSEIVNNFVTATNNITVISDTRSVNNKWCLATPVKSKNIVGGAYLGGNYWSNYNGRDTNGDGLGDTNLPYNDFGKITVGTGDIHPLVKS